MKIRHLSFTVLILVALLTSIPSFSQEKDFGMRAGWQRAATINDGDQVDGSLSSLYVGIFRERPIGPKNTFSWLGGLEYSQQGHKDSNDTFRKLHYISLPLALRVRYGQVYLQGGTNFNFKVAEVVEIDGENIDDEDSYFLDIPLHLGVGFNFGRLGLEARYHWGLLDVHKGNNNQYFQFGGSIQLF